MRGIDEIQSRAKPSARVRKAGAGRKRTVEKQPRVRALIEEIVEPDSRGDPETPLRWTCKSVRNISELLKKHKCDVSRQTVANILHELEFSLQGNRKTKEGDDHPDRDKQFRFINKTAKAFLAKGIPVISVDTKKKELVGNYKNVGREWRKKGSPVDVNGHDFPDPAVPKAIPYGIYDIGENKGWISVGITADTAEFAVNSIGKWWKSMGIKKYPNAKCIMICADSGGSNSYRSHLWKRELQKLCDTNSLEVSVRHFPPGTSKWNKIEHRLFSFVSMNWRGQPLLTYQTIIDLIASTRTKTGLEVKARLDKRKYEKGIKVPKAEIAAINLKRDDFHGEWNYTISPRQC
jgi:transposase